VTAKRRLGRGLDALLKPEAAQAASAPAREPGKTDSPETQSPEASAAAPGRSIPTSKLRPNRLQPRSYFDDTALDELAESIRAQGIVQPLVVTEEGDGFRIVAGERRWRAAQRAGLSEVPVFIREVEDDRELLALALVENVQRADLNPIEEAEAYQILIGDHGLGQEDVGRLVGKTRAAVANTVRLLRLNETVQEMVRSGALSAGQARPLLSLETEAEQLVLAERAIAEGLTARRLEQLASPRKKKKARREEKDPDTRAAEEKLERKLQTKVEIRRSGAGGTVALHFHSEEELMGLFDMLMSAAEER